MATHQKRPTEKRKGTAHLAPAPKKTNEQEWTGGVFPAPTFVMDEDPYRPDVVVGASSFDLVMRSDRFVANQ